MLHSYGFDVEVREGPAGGVSLAGSFPYLAESQLAAGRFERFEPRALEPADDVRLLVSHDWGRPLASVGAGSLSITNDDEALSFEARIDPAVMSAGYVRDALAALRARLILGFSPGFVVPPGGDTVTARSDGGVVRSIQRAQLHEVSIVTRAAYSAAAVEARCWQIPALQRRRVVLL